MLLKILILFSSLSFIIFGVNCLYSQKMVFEFQRYGLKHYRILTGILQLLGSFSLIIGFWIPSFTLVGSGGLAMLMLLGVLVRIRIKDKPYLLIPAIFFMCLNIVILGASLIHMM
ncbi:DoxX family protein [Eudoraea adriatica]|uniref:DoxX family protein n=1 Tax=Eudoraea adriatica TaxID=446681 RepID=UPI0004757728|nr:DoxX family protein [Eudoraea adriatica]